MKWQKVGIFPSCDYGTLVTVSTSLVAWEAGHFHWKTGEYSKTLTFRAALRSRTRAIPSRVFRRPRANPPDRGTLCTRARRTRSAERKRAEWLWKWNRRGERIERKLCSHPKRHTGHRRRSTKTQLKVKCSRQSSSFEFRERKRERVRERGREREERERQKERQRERGRECKKVRERVLSVNKRSKAYQGTS